MKSCKDRFIYSLEIDLRDFLLSSKNTNIFDVGRYKCKWYKSATENKA